MICGIINIGVGVITLFKKEKPRDAGESEALATSRGGLDPVELIQEALDLKAGGRVEVGIESAAIELCHVVAEFLGRHLALEDELMQESNLIGRDGGARPLRREIGVLSHPRDKLVRADFEVVDEVREGESALHHKDRFLYLFIHLQVPFCG